jgi:hypothetical protein
MPDTKSDSETEEDELESEPPKPDKASKKSDESLTVELPRPSRSW